MGKIKGQGCWGWRNWDNHMSTAGIILFSTLLIAVIYLSRDGGRVELRELIVLSAAAVNRNAAAQGVDLNNSNNINRTTQVHDDDTVVILSDNNNKKEKKRSKTSCNMFSGNWVFDNKSYPLYRDWNCSFMFDDLACEKYHRPDLNYQYWRWQPDHCDLPKFNAKALLQVLRNKRLVFVGDSLNRNQWVSMVCLLESAIPPELKSRKLQDNLYSFTAKEYNASIDFYWAPFLVESNSDDPSNHHSKDRVVRIYSIEKHAKNWGNAHILVFNSYIWWRSVTKLKLLLRGSFGSPDAIYQEMNNRKSYKMALRTWSEWILSHLDYNNTRLFWVSISPTHTRPENWGKAAGGSGKCMNETRVTEKEELRGSEVDPELMSITGDAIGSLKKKGVDIDVLDITQLSEYRKDGHPTIFRKQWRPLTKEQLANPWSYADCAHWCLPGVPDVWNEILYAYLMQ